MRLWIGIQYLIVAAYFALAMVIWGTIGGPIHTLLFLSLCTGPVLVYCRSIQIVDNQQQLSDKQLQAISLYLVVLGLLLVVILAICYELFWYLKETFFGSGRGNLFGDLFWEFGQMFFVVLGLSCGLNCLHTWWSTVISKDSVLSELSMGFRLIFLWFRNLRLFCLCLISMCTTGLLSGAFGGICVFLGIYTADEVFGTLGPNSPEFILAAGGFALSVIPIFFMTYWIYPTERLSSDLTDPTTTSNPSS